MGTVYPPFDAHDLRDEIQRRSNTCRHETLSLLEEETRHHEDQPPLRGDGFAEDVLSLIEENARLRGLVVKLSDIILRNVAEQK